MRHHADSFVIIKISLPCSTSIIYLNGKPQQENERSSENAQKENTLNQNVTFFPQIM